MTNYEKDTCIKLIAALAEKNDCDISTVLCALTDNSVTQELSQQIAFLKKYQ